MEKIVIFGGSGFIGKHLVEELKNDYNVIVISRHKNTTKKKLDKNVRVERLRHSDISKMTDAAEGAKAIINLAGENVGSKWSKRKMEQIEKSRLDIDSVVVRVIRSTKEKPKMLLQGSAIGIYGYSRTSEDITEETSYGQRGFLPKLAKSHEEAVEQVKSLVRIVYLRTGMVLGNDGGALPKIERQYKMGLGGQMGSGQHWNSWIHIKDEVRAIRYLLESETSSGAYNLTAPNPVTNKLFSQTIAKTMGKPNFFTTPAFVLRLGFGAMASELLLSGVKVLPARLLEDGFKFKYRNLESALEELLD
jgi:uncharacterized protein (TIGR01777 family)